MPEIHNRCHSHCRSSLLRMLLCMCLLSASLAHAADKALEMRAYTLQPSSGIYLLNAQLVFAVPSGVEQAIHDGATLNLNLQIKFVRGRRFWTDETLAELEQHYALMYHRVSERYLVRNLNSGSQSSYANFAEAIDSLKNIDALPVLDVDLIKPHPRNEVSVRAGSEVRTIPRVLGVLLFWVDDFSLQSDWYTWPLNP